MKVMWQAFSVFPFEISSSDSRAAVFVYHIVLNSFAYFSGLVFNPKKDKFAVSFFTGWGATVMAGLSAYALDTVRRRMLISYIDFNIRTSLPFSAGTSLAYKNEWDAVNSIIQKEGFASLLDGAFPNLVRGVMNGLVMIMIDMFQESTTEK